MPNQIVFDIELDKEQMPEKITWQASQAGNQPQDCKAMMVSLWDGNAKQTLKIDLWTKEMPVEEMNLYFYQTLHTTNLCCRQIHLIRFFGSKKLGYCCLITKV